MSDDQEGRERPIRRVMVGVDFEQPALRAARWSARTFGPDAELLLVHCLSASGIPAFLESAARIERRVEEEAERARVRLERLTADFAPTKASVVVRQGRPVEELSGAAAEHEGDLIVVGEHGARPGLRATLGSSASQLPMVAPVPVLIKRHLPERKPRRILAALDPVGSFELVLRWTRWLAAYQGSPGDVTVHVSLEPEWGGDASRPEQLGRSGEDHNRLLLARDWLEEVAGAAGLSDARIDVGAGDPRYEILAVQRRHAIDVVLVGRRGSGNSQSGVIGSVANTILHAASCSVLVV